MSEPTTTPASDRRLSGTVTLTFRIPEKDEKAALFLRAMLKRLWRDRGWRCTVGELNRAPLDAEKSDPQEPSE